MEKRQRRASEAWEQTALIQWTRSTAIRKEYPELALLYHTPNGGSRNLAEARRLKEQGVKRGVPDLCLPVARGGYHGLYIEMKSVTGRLSKEQRWWRDRLEEQGYCWQLCRSFREATLVLRRYMEERKILERSKT